MEQEQQLFLIELLVDRVKIPVVRAMHENILPASTCVSFQILGLPPINICQDSPTDGCACTEGDTEIFRKGKSCLFALPSNVLQKPLTSFPINMSVYKKLPPGVLPDVMLIGSHQIEAKDMINELLTKHIFKTANPSKTTKDTYKITTATGQHVGEVTVFVRASCFGKKIVTQFQIPHNKKPYLFKGTDDSPVFQCKRIPSKAQNPAPLRCNCPVRNVNDGSGESTGRTCCKPPITEDIGSAQVPRKYKQPDTGPRPCCPSRLPPSGSLGQSSPNCPACTTQPYPQDQQVAASRNCSLQSEQKQPLKSSVLSGCACCAPQTPPPQQPQKSPCAPCCGIKTQQLASKGYKAFSDLLNKQPATRKCGCPVKEELSCNCAQKK